jgi:hypothetical protein
LPRDTVDWIVCWNYRVFLVHGSFLPYWLGSIILPFFYK